jgi:hypothetical protein
MAAEAVPVMFCDFLQRWPTLKQAQRARHSTLSAFFVAHNVRYPKVIEQRLVAIRAATPLTQDSAVITPHRLLVEALVEQLRVTLQAIDRFDTEIEAAQESENDQIECAKCTQNVAFRSRLAFSSRIVLIIKVAKEPGLSAISSTGRRLARASALKRLVDRRDVGQAVHA